MSAEAMRTQNAGTVSAAAGRQAEPVKKQPTAAQRMKQRRKRNALLRACIQAVFFVTMPGAFMAAFSGVKSIFLAISDGSALEMGSFVKALLGLGIFTILFGRFFCGFACAFGTAPHRATSPTIASSISAIRARKRASLHASVKAPPERRQ